MRLPWRTARPAPDLAPDVRAWIDSQARLPEAGPADVERARLLVAARIAAERAPAGGGSFRRRLALGSLGGGALWSGFVGFAAAHQAASVAVGLGLLVAGSTAAEVTGIRPAMSEFVAERVNNDSADEERQAGSSPTVGASKAKGAPGAAHGRSASQLVLEGTLEGITSASLTVRAASESTTLPVGPRLVAIGLDGRAEDPSDLVGLQVLVAADCEHPGDTEDECAARLVRVVGSSGQGNGGTAGQSGDAPGHGGTTPGQSENAPGQGGSTPGRSEDAPGQSGDTPGQGGGTPPGQDGSSAPGNAPPEPPGQGGAPPGHGDGPPGQGGGNGGPGGDAPGQSADPPGQGGGNAGGNGNGPPNQ